MRAISEELADFASEAAGAKAAVYDEDEERPARPIGAAFLLAGVDRDGRSSVYHVDPRGFPRRAVRADASARLGRVDAAPTTPRGSSR